MKKSLLLVFTVLVLCAFPGFTTNDNPNRLNLKFHQTQDLKQTARVISDNSNPNSSTTAYYTDNFDGANDSAALVGRGYKIYRNGTSSGTASPETWFQGFPASRGGFDAYNGPDSGYVASIWATAGDLGNINNWLVLPPLNVLTGDSICFYSRSPLGDTFPDSIRVYYNPTGNTLPSDPNWIELGRFKVNTSGVWELKGFIAPGSGANARFAIVYSVVSSGLFGANGDYIGVDALNVKRDNPLPVELTNFVSVISNNNVTLNWTTASETNNSGFDIERSVVNGEWSRIGNVAGNGTSTSPNNYSFTDRNLNSGNYHYRLKQIDINGNFEYFNLGNEVIIGVPGNFELSQNYPNPFNPSTKIDYQLPANGIINISVFDNSGKEVMTLVNEFKTTGYYTINFNASGLSSGVYFYRISSDNFTSVKKMMLVK